jgi:hypothetical protein
MFWKIVFLLAIVFVLTYDPNSRTLEKFVGQPMAAPSTEKSCEHAHYEAVQFAQTPYECPPSGKTKMGVVM